MLTEREGEFLEALKKDLGKGEYADFVSEIGFVICEIDLALNSLKKWAKERPVSTPLGIVAFGTHS